MTQWKIAFVVGITLFSMGLPLLIIGSISTGEDNLAMIIPGAILTGVGGFLAVGAWFTPVSYTHLTLPTICSV